MENEGERERGRLSDRRCGEKGSVRQGRPVVIASGSASRTGLKRVTRVRRGRGERGNERDRRNRSLVFRHGPDNVRYGEIPLSRLVNRSIYVCTCVFFRRFDTRRRGTSMGLTSGVREGVTVFLFRESQKIAILSEIKVVFFRAS